MLKKMAASSLVFIVLTLLIGHFTLLTFASPKNKRVLVEENDGLVEMEKQLKAINKPATKSFKTEEGDILDCVDFNKQLAFDHPLLKNHIRTIQVIPKMVSKSNINPWRFECPNGTVIIKRISKQDLIRAHQLQSAGFGRTNGNGHHSAGLGYKGKVLGARGIINLWDPHVSPRQFSLARVLVSRDTNSIQVGWRVDPSRHKENSLYSYWTADGYKKTGCFDMECPGFVQVSRQIPLGTDFGAASSRDRFQYNINVTIVKESGDWSLYYENEKIGYWPKTLFTPQGLAEEASYASWGGEVYSPNGEKSPPMGSGSFAQEGYRRAAFINVIEVNDGSGAVRRPTGVAVYADQPKCYNAKYISSGGSPWNSAVFYGGPGGC